MSQSTEATRPDPLLDAYRQASAREGARAGGNLRATVLAHARVVAQWSPDAVAATGLSALPEATRATPAANEQRPIWRLAAGVVIGLIGVWIFQLTRPSAAPDTTVAAADVVPAAQADKARAAVPVGAALPRVPSPVAAAAPEASVAVAAVSVATDSAQKPANAARARPPEAGLPERNPAMANAPALRELPDRPPVFAGTTVAAAPVVAQAAAPASASTADASTTAMAEELVIASAEVRKSAKAQSGPDASAAAAAVAAPSRAGASRVVVARGVSEAPETAPAVATASRSQRPAQLGDAASRGRLGEPELAMFTAVRAGDLSALRIAITRGANVNSKDEGGRTPLQIARERADTETIRALDAAGAR